LSTINFEPVGSSFVADQAIVSRWSLPDLAERAAGCALLALAAPAIAVSAAAVSMLSGRSPLVAHLRVGRHGKPFWTLKLRTMWKGREHDSASPRWIEYVIAEPAEDDKDRCDPRITSRFAAFCRRHSIDELPQLWHVARGHMALVGPRPLTRSELARHYGPNAAELLSVKPGITGLWQVYGRSAIRFPQRSAIDLQMVRSLNLRMYLRILLRTLPAIVFGRGAW